MLAKIKQHEDQKQTWKWFSYVEWEEKAEPEEEGKLVIKTKKKQVLKLEKTVIVIGIKEKKNRQECSNKIGLLLVFKEEEEPKYSTRIKEEEERERYFNWVTRKSLETFGERILRNQ